MSKLLFVPLIGRFGNLMFIYSHARAWSEQNGYELCLPPWVGEQVFTIPQAVRPDQYEPDEVWMENMRQHQDDLIYTRKQVREWFTLKPEIKDRLRGLETQSEAVLLNVREGQDYRDAGLVTLSKECYKRAAHVFGYDPDHIDWETDTHYAKREGFDGDMSASGLGTTMVGIPSFYRLMTANTLFRANSTFSWWAATLGNGKVYSPVIKGVPGGIPDQYCSFVEGNWPVMADCPQNSDLHLPE